MPAIDLEIGDIVKFIAGVRSVQHSGVAANAGQESLLNEFWDSLRVDFNVTFYLTGPDGFIFEGISVSDNMTYNVAHQEVIESWIQDISDVIREMERDMEAIDAFTTPQAVAEFIKILIGAFRGF